MKKPDFGQERRVMPRVSARCDAELVTSISILDSNTDVVVEPLIFLGETRDISPQGLGVIVPSTRIDEKYCSESNSLKLSLYLPDGLVGLEVNPVRCVPLNARDEEQGYFLGAKIINVTDQNAAFERYLQSLTSPAGHAE